MENKINLAVNGQELTVYYKVGDGPRASCHYCGKEDGVEQLVVIKSVECDAMIADLSTSVYTDAVRKVKKELYHRRGICELGSPCDRKYQADQYASVWRLATLK